MALGTDHRHCKVCGKVTAAGNDTCGPKCAAVREERLRQRRNYQYLIYGAIALVAVFFLASYLG